ncbi:MAG: two component transcriptional regulator, partial [Bacillus sp. (in: firmicutes)]|nr:two component transcriptional regulator [Bacillus sp. (in: firmicutes)]
LKMYLEKESYQIDTDDNGFDGLEKAVNQHFDLIILAILVPMKVGFEVLEELRRTKSTPVIMISSKCGDFNKKHSMELGATDYILMPFSPREIVVKIKDHLKKGA